MYRLPRILSIAFSLSAYSFAGAQAPSLEESVLGKVLSGEKRSLAVTDRNDDRTTSNTQSTDKSEPTIDEDFGFINFDEVFSAVPDSMRLGPSNHLDLLGPVAIARFPIHLDIAHDGDINNKASVRPVLVDNIPAVKVESKAAATTDQSNGKTAVPASKLPATVAPAPPANTSTKTASLTAGPTVAEPIATAPGSSAAVAAMPSQSSPSSQTEGLPTLAYEGIGNGVTIEDHTILDGQPVPHAAVVDGSCGELQMICDTCDTCESSPCHCRSKRSSCSHLSDWWHNTKLYRKHLHNIGHPALFCERPLGVCNEGFSAAMISAGKADRAVLHYYDFVRRPDGAITLSPQGLQTLCRIAKMICDYPIPLTVESTLDPALDQASRLAVLNAISQLGLPIAPECVVVAADPSIGVSGIEAETIQRIREAEMATGASRVRPYNNFSGATVIPFIGVEDESQ